MRINRKITQNWAKTYESKPRDIFYLKTQKEIIHLLQYCNKYQTPLKVVGGANSYNDIFCPGEYGFLVSLEKFNKLLEVDEKNATATFEGGMMIPDLLKQLKKHNLTLSNLGTNIFDSVSGACSTGYHGSGIEYQIFSSFVKEFEIVTPTAEVKLVKNTDKDFDIYAVGLGVLGIITKITLQCEPSFHMEVIEKQMSLDDIEDNFEELLKQNDHFKFIWIPHTNNFMVWLGNRCEKPEERRWKKLQSYFVIGVLINNIFHEFLLFFASFIRSLIPKINKLMAKILLPKKESKNVWNSYWAFFLPHLLKQDVVEYAFDIKDTFQVFRQTIETIKEKKIFVDTPIEVRFVKGDSYWMSPSGESDACWIGTKIHFPYGRKPKYQNYFATIDAILARYGGRPHWGKQFRITTQEFKKVYPKWDQFWEYADKEDPNKILQNDFVKRLRGKM